MTLLCEYETVATLCNFSHAGEKFIKMKNKIVKNKNKDL